MRCKERGKIEMKEGKEGGREGGREKGVRELIDNSLPSISLLYYIPIAAPPHLLLLLLYLYPTK